LVRSAHGGHTPPGWRRTDLSAHHQGPAEAIAAAVGEVFTTARRKGTTKCRSGTEAGKGFLMATDGWSRTCVDLRILVGAGEGNRTLMTSLEDRGCEIGVLADQAMPLIPGS